MNSGNRGRFLGPTKDRVVTFTICLFYDFLKPLKIWYHLDNFYFHYFQKIWTKERSRSSWLQLQKNNGDFEFFPFLPPWNNKNKSCLNELKFWEASENHKSSICWKFQLSISCGTQKSAKIPRPGTKMIWFFSVLFLQVLYIPNLGKYVTCS